MLCLAGFSRIYAHALWIEASPQGAKGTPHEIRVYFGEFTTQDITPVEKWFSDTREFSLVVITPSAKTITLTATPAQDYFTASFVPEEEGVYTVVMHHLVKELYRGMRLHYNSSALVKVGNGPAAAPAANTNEIGITPDTPAIYKVNDQVSFRAFLRSLPAGKKEIEVIDPGGWTKKLYTNPLDETSFEPTRPGKYMLEVTNSAKASGEHNGKPVETDYWCATYVIEVTGK